MRFWFRNAYLLDKPLEVLDTVGHLSECQPCVFTSSLRTPPYQLLHFAPVLGALANHHCDPAVREQAKSKVWLREPRSFPCLSAQKNYTVKRKFFQSIHINKTAYFMTGEGKEDNHMKDILYSRGVDTAKVIQVIETKSA